MVGAVERDAYAAACLVARMEDQTLDCAPIWDCLETFDPEPWAGRVDLISAGFPCQPFSVAGAKRGKQDDRWLWPDIARIVRVVRPSLVFLENSDALVGFRFRREFGQLLGDLADLGFDAEWGLLSAGDVGATHRRRRFWLLAYCDRVVDTDSVRWHLRPRVAHTTSHRGKSTNAGCFPPSPDDKGGWDRWLTTEGPEPSVCRGADGLASRMDRLHTIGNGVVPLVAASAFVRLARRGGLVTETP